MFYCLQHLQKSHSSVFLSNENSRTAKNCWGIHFILHLSSPQFSLPYISKTECPQVCGSLPWKPPTCYIRVRVRVTLRLTVSQSVYLGVGHPFGAHDQILLFPFLLPENCFTLCLAAPSLTRRRICNLLFFVLFSFMFYTVCGAAWCLYCVLLQILDYRCRRMCRSYGFFL
jgi:hypothetical protein